MAQMVSTDRKSPHEEVVKSLEENGFDTEWVKPSLKTDIEHLTDVFTPEAERTLVLDWLEVEGQVTDGLFEDPSSEYDFTRFFTELQPLVGRMMYYMKSVCGLEYTYEDLVDDVEKLSNLPYYDAPFDRETVLNAR